MRAGSGGRGGGGGGGSSSSDDDDDGGGGGGGHGGGHAGRRRMKKGRSHGHGLGMGTSDFGEFQDAAYQMFVEKKAAADAAGQSSTMEAVLEGPLEVRCRHAIFKTATWRKRHVMFSSVDQRLYVCLSAADGAQKIFEDDVDLADAKDVLQVLTYLLTY
jgi:hypothetical protein